MRNKLQQVQTQKLNITVNLVQSLKILSMGRLEIEELAEQESMSNPVLDVEIDKGEVDWDEYIRRHRENVYFDKNEVSYHDNNEYDFENMTKSYDTLYDRLHGQINTMYMPPEEKIVCNYLIDSLDNHGFLVDSDAEIAQILKISESLVEKCIAIVQTLEPYGICARSISECMILQLKNSNLVDETLYSIIENDLNLVANSDIKKLSTKYSVSKNQVHKYIEIIKSLNPKPAELDQDDTVAYIYPDVVLEFLDGKYVAKHYNEKKLNFSINDYYTKLYTTVDDEGVKSYIKEHLNKAKEFINEYEGRNSTIVNIANAILSIQNEFFTNGILKPMTLSDISDIIGCHVSTVSRGVNDKYMLTPKGLLEFKYFFSSSFQRGDGEVISTNSVKQEIKKIIDAEDSSKPLSDSKIEKILNNKGYEIARRTVAKYREELGYLSSSMRKRI